MTLLAAYPFGLSGVEFALTVIGGLVVTFLACAWCIGRLERRQMERKRQEAESFFEYGGRRLPR